MYYYVLFSHNIFIHHLEFHIMNPDYTPFPLLSCLLPSLWLSLRKKKEEEEQEEEAG